MRRQVAALAAAALGGLGCASLPTLEGGVCGNGVLEAGEACDPPAKAVGFTCRPPGGLGECQYDCSGTSDESRAKCPGALGCARDGVCRAETGGFEAATEPLSPLACSWLSQADFDGDGRSEVLSAEPSDLLQQARFRLHYLQRDGDLDETRTFPRLTTRPLVVEVSDDRRADLVFSNLRVGMVPGRADREWVPSAFSSYVVDAPGLRVVGVSPELVGGATALVAIATLSGEAGLFVPDFATGDLEPRSPLPGPVEQLAGEPLAADVITGVDSPCSEVVLAFRGDDRLHVFDMCKASGDPREPDLVWRPQALARVVELPEGAAIDAAPLVGDVDGDGRPDLVVGSRGRAFVAYGRDGAPPASAEPLQILVEAEKPDGSVEPDYVALSSPLSLGDLSGDGIADFVLPELVLSSYTRREVPGVRFRVSAVNRGVAWTMARLGDLNGNDAADVVAGSDGAPGLTFLNGTDGPHQIAAELSTRGPLRFLTTGDFDGDLIRDVAYVEDGASLQKQFLSVAFGAVHAPPALSRQVAELQGVEQLSAHAERGYEHLLVSTRERVGGEEAGTLTLFDGDSDRLPFATFSLVTFSVDGSLEDSLAVSLVAGAFSGPGSKDVVALGSRLGLGVPTLWLVPSLGSKVPPVKLTGPELRVLQPTRLQGQSLTLRASGVAADVDADGRDEALWLMPGADDQCVLGVYDIDGRGRTFSQSAGLGLGQPCPEPELGAADLDASGGVDLLALVGEAPRRLLVLWNDGEGSFSLSRATELSEPNGADVRAFSVFPRRGGELLRVAFASAVGLNVADWSGEGEVARYDRVLTVQPLDEGRAVVAADANTDGVTDLFAADAHGLWLYRAELK